MYCNILFCQTTGHLCHFSSKWSVTISMKRWNVCTVHTSNVLKHIRLLQPTLLPLFIIVTCFLQWILHWLLDYPACYSRQKVLKLSLWQDSSTRCVSSLKGCTKFTFILFLSVLSFPPVFWVIIKNILQYVLAEMFWYSSYSYLTLLILFKTFNVSWIIYSCFFGTQWIPFVVFFSLSK